MAQAEPASLAGLACQTARPDSLSGRDHYWPIQDLNEIWALREIARFAGDVPSMSGDWGQGMVGEGGGGGAAGV